MPAPIRITSKASLIKAVLGNELFGVTAKLAIGPKISWKPEEV